MALRILPWQFGMLGLKQNGGNHLFKYADRLIDGVSESRLYVSSSQLKPSTPLLGFAERWYGPSV